MPTELKPVTDAELRAAVMRYTKAHLQFMEFQLADVKTARYRWLLKMSGCLFKDQQRAFSKLLRLGNRLLAEGRKR